MTTANTPMTIDKNTQQSVIEFHRQSTQLMGQQYNLREKMCDVDRTYMREKDRTKENERAKVANRYGDADKYQNITVPVVMPQVESAVQYQASVFLTGHPIFGVVASPNFMDEALQMETVIMEQQHRGGWVRELMQFFRDGFKYNMAAIEVDWAKEVTPTFETDIGFAGGKQGKPKEVIWEGNRLKRWDLYNTFFDVRVPVTEMHKKGEFCGHTELLSRIELKALINSLPDKIVSNIVPAFESGSGFMGSGTPSGEGSFMSYYLPELNPNTFVNKNTIYSTDWMAWAGLNQRAGGQQIQYKNYYEVSTLYARILPSDFGMKVPNRNTPQVWKFIIVNHQVVIYAERLTNAHGWIPVIFGQPYEDGLMYQTKSMVDNVEPLQSVSSALMNGMIHSRRRALSDRVLYDPSRISEHHINNANPAAKIPVRPAAYGKAVGESVYAFPYRDDQAGLQMQEIQQITSFANLITGQNPARQGQFVKGNKTKFEFADVMGNANGRDQMVALLLEDQVFQPIKHMIKINILQFQGGTQLFNTEREQEVQIDPIKLRKAVLEFKISDGLIPAEKQINAESFQVALQVIGTSPQIGPAYNIAPMFSYLMKTQGADLSPFEKSPEQQAYEQALGSWQQMAALAIEKGQEFTQPQPLPEQFGYNPGQMGTSAGNPAQAAAQQTRVNNITNNITNNEV